MWKLPQTRTECPQYVATCTIVSFSTLIGPLSGSIVCPNPNTAPVSVTHNTRAVSVPGALQAFATVDVHLIGDLTLKYTQHTLVFGDVCTRKAFWARPMPSYWLCSRSTLEMRAGTCSYSDSAILLLESILITTAFICKNYNMNRPRPHSLTVNFPTNLLIIFKLLCYLDIDSSFWKMLLFY